jgi:hypothetical protein
MTNEASLAFVRTWEGDSKSPPGRKDSPDAGILATMCRAAEESDRAELDRILAARGQS